LARELRVAPAEVEAAAAAGTIRLSEAGGPVVEEAERQYLLERWRLLHTLRRGVVEHDVPLAVLFGSVARGDERPSSDVDLLVAAGGKGAAELQRWLRAHTDRWVEVTDLAHAARTPLLLMDALQDGRVIVDRDARWPLLQGGAAEVSAAADLARNDLLRAEREAVRELTRR
jgi:predicted nucleotidyltransferase